MKWKNGANGERSIQTKKYGELTQIAYLWTRTVKCKSPSCDAVVPLVRQTWLCKKSGKFIALKVSPDPKKKIPKFTVVSSYAKTETEAIEKFGFDPGKLSKEGETKCIFCGTTVTNDYVKQEGQAKRMDKQLMAVICTKEDEPGKIYLSADEVPEDLIPDEKEIWERIEKLCEETGLSVPDEPLLDKSADQLPMYGMPTYGDMFTPRQLLALLTFTKWVRNVHKVAATTRENDFYSGVSLLLSLLIDRLA